MWGLRFGVGGECGYGWRVDLRGSGRAGGAEIMRSMLSCFLSGVGFLEKALHCRA